MKRLIAKFQPWRVFLLTTSAVLVFSSLLIQPVYAITQNDLNSIFLNTPFYDPLASNCINAAGTSVLSGSDNQEKAFNYFVSQGLNTVQAAAILGNLMEESGVNPKSVQSGGPGNGIAQWSSGGRWDATDPHGGYKLDTVYHFAGVGTKSARDVHDLGVQLDFIWWEITEGPYTKVLGDLKKFTNSSDLNKATELWMLKYESPDPSVAHLDVRQSDAKDAFNNYGGSTAESAGARCSGTGNFATNFITYKQCDWYSNYSATQAERNAARAWSDSPYGAGTVCGDGCGIAAIAMAITNMTGNRVTPDVTAAWGAAHGTGGKGGSDGNALIRVFGTPKWRLKGAPIDALYAAAPHNNPGVWDIQKINDTLRQGGLVLMRGHMQEGPKSDPKYWEKQGPFSIPGHFILIRAITSDGKWLTGNSGGWPDNAEYDPQWLYAHTTIHDSWAITKG